MGNTVLVPELNPTRGISTGDYENLIRFDQVTDGHLLTTDTLAQMVVKAGGTTAVASSCSTGAAFLLNHKLDGLIVNHSYILPDPLSRTIKAQFGTAPEPFDTQQFSPKNRGQGTVPKQRDPKNDNRMKPKFYNKRDL